MTRRFSFLALLALALAPLLVGWAPIRIDGPNSPILRWTSGYEVPIHVHTGGYPGIAFNRVRSALEDSLATWTAVNGSTIVFIRDPAGRDGDTPAVDGINQIRFETEALPPEIDPDSVLAWTSPVSATCTGVLIEADITFNAVTVRWDTADASRLSDIETVSLHEVGHLLGLDHSRDRGAVMFPSVQERVRRDLHPDDVAGVRALYAPAVGAMCDQNGDCANGEVCQFTLQSDESVSAHCGAALGRAGPGQGCNADAGPCDSGCSNGLCFGDGQCSAVCETNAHCPRGWTCFAQDVGGGQTQRFCIDRAPCADADACGAGEACTLAADAEDTLVTLCVEAGDQPDDTACDNSDDCAGGMCWEGLCTRLCDDDAQCPPTRLCITESLNLGGRVQDFDLCDRGPLCDSDADCANGTRCAWLPILERRRASFCIQPGGAEAGAACDTDADCQSRLCFESRCGGVCEANEDCPGDLICDQVRVQGQLLSVCLSETAGEGGQGGTGGAGGIGGQGGAGAGQGGAGAQGGQGGQGGAGAQGGQGGAGAQGGPGGQGGGPPTIDAGQPDQMPTPPAVIVREVPADGGCRFQAAPTPPIGWLVFLAGFVLRRRMGKKSDQGD